VPVRQPRDAAAFRLRPWVFGALTLLVALALVVGVGLRRGVPPDSATSSPTMSTTDGPGNATTTTTIRTAPADTFPNAATTGVPAGTALTPSGSITVTADGSVVDAKDVTGCIAVRADNVTIKNTRVRYGASGCASNMIENHGSNLVVQDSEIDGQRDPNCGQAIGTGNYTLERADMHDCSDGPRGGGGPVTILDSWVHNLSNLPGDHGDGYQCHAGNGPSTAVVNTLIRHNTIEGGTTSAIFTADYCDGPFVLDDNLLYKGGYTLALYDQQATITNNVFVRDTWAYGPVATYSGPKPGNPDKGTTILAWTNNRICENPDGTGLAETIPKP
jgi:hypothetical protein